MSRAGGAAPRHEWIPLEDGERWRAALAGVPHDLAHTWGYCRALAATFPDPTFLYAFTDGDVRIVCPFVERSVDARRDIATPPGFAGFAGTGPHPTFAAEWAAFAAARGYVCGYVGLNPVLDDPSYAPAHETHEHNAAYLLDLTPGPERLLAALDRNRRRQLRDREGAAASLVHDRERLTEFLVAEYPGFLRSVGASPSYARTAATLRALCALDGVFLVGTADGDEVTSVYAFGHTPYVGTCLILVARPEARRHATVLLWQGVLHLHALGVPVLNLGGGVRPDDAIAASKRRSGGVPRPLRALRQVYDPSAYARLCRAVGADPDDRTYFPAYRRPGAPPGG